VIQTEQARRLTQFKKGNDRLLTKVSLKEWKLLVEAELEMVMLKEHSKRNFLLNASFVGQWVSTSAPSVNEARSSIWKSPCSGIVFVKPERSISTGAAAWPTF
jgi:hypothetical protein